MRSLKIIACVAMAALMAACSGGAKTIVGTTGTTGTGTTGTTKTVLSMGSGTGSSFESGKLAISTSSLSAGGSTSLQVSIVDQTGALYTTSTTVTFSSPCQSQGLATIDATGVTPAAPTVTTTTGGASATYAATGCSGSDVVTVTATANGQSLTATGTVTVAAAAIGSISFISATPSNITLQGEGSTATSTVVFKVFDTSGGPRAGATVNFSLNTAVGGISISPASATTDANGQVQTVVSGGTVATTVRVTASTTTTTGTVISTQSSALTVSTGIPTSNNISLAVKCPNVEAWNYDGVTVPVTVSMTDRFSNPVPNGTTANFVTTLGGIDATCQTTSGSCQVNWHSKAPYSVGGNPATTANTAYTNTTANWCATNSPYCNGTTNGRSPIVVTAIGEESFVDANGNGIFDAGDTVAFDPSNKDNDFANGSAKPWQDTQEPFLNQWELYDTYGTPVYIPGEFFIDFNKNGSHDGPDGYFNGSLCTGSLCSTTQTSVAIGTGNVIVASGSSANYVLTSENVYSATAGVAGTYTLVGGVPVFTLPATIYMYIFDQNYQIMPNGTTVGVTFSTNAGTLTTPPPAAVPCGAPLPTFDSSGNVKTAGVHYAFGASPPTSGAVAGTMFVTVTSPRGLVTTIPIAVSN